MDGTSPETTAEYSERSFLNWQAAAAGWDGQRAYISRTMRPLTEWLIEALDPRPGESLLELAAGPGELALDFAPRLQPGGRLICTDRSPNMVEAARKASLEHALEGVEHRVADAQQLDMGDAQMDAVVCRMGYMLMADPDGAMSETRRVLRPGGRVAFVVWGEPDENAWATTLFGVLEQQAGLPPAAPGGPGIFALAADQRLSALIVGAGLELRRSDRLPVTWEYPTFDAYWDVQSSLNGGLARLVTELPAAELAHLREQVLAAIDPYRTPDGGYRLPGLAVGVLAG